MFIQGDATRLPFRDASVDLVFGSPPYADARSYGIGAQRKCQEWIEWMLTVTAEACRVSRGLVLWVVAGVTRKHCYWPGPEGLLYRWWAAGGQCWRPAYWHRVGIPGSGGKQWLRADVEYVLAFKGQAGPVPWADNTANGHPPKWAPGGEMSYRLSDGARVNQFGHSVESGATVTNGDVTRSKRKRPSHRLGRGMANGIPGSTKGGCLGRRVVRGSKDGDTVTEDAYLPPALANPGTLIQGILVGGGVMGHKAAHENEAPFPVKLCEWFIRGWCPPGGTVLDPFIGSGSMIQAARQLGRVGIGMDIRENQLALTARRVREVQPVLCD